MFSGASSYTQKLCWDVSNADTTYMFYDSSGSIECAYSLLVVA